MLATGVLIITMHTPSKSPGPINALSSRPPRMGSTSSFRPENANSLPSVTKERKLHPDERRADHHHADRRRKVAQVLKGVVSTSGRRIWQQIQRYRNDAGNHTRIDDLADGEMLFRGRAVPRCKTVTP